MSRLITAYIGLGSNLCNPQFQIRQAITALAGLTDCKLVRTSPLYRSKPMGPAEQPDYVNAVAELQTSLSAFELLDKLQELEQLHGRVRTGQRWGPRTLDLDLLLYGDCEIDEARLKVPHVGIAERNFVLYPLRDIAVEDLIIPGFGYLSELVRACTTEGLELIKEC